MTEKEPNPLNDAEDNLNPIPKGPEDLNGRDHVEEAEIDMESKDITDKIDEAEKDLS